MDREFEDRNLSMNAEINSVQQVKVRLLKFCFTKFTKFHGKVNSVNCLVQHSKCVFNVYKTREMTSSFEENKPLFSLTFIEI